MNPLLVLRVNARLTKAELAAKAEVSYNTINDFERGRSSLQDGTRIKLAEALGVKPAALLDPAPFPSEPKAAA